MLITLIQVGKMRVTDTFSLPHPTPMYNSKASGMGLTSLPVPGMKFNCFKANMEIPLPLSRN